MAKIAFSDIQVGDRVTCLIPNGRGREGVEYKEKAGRAVMRSSVGGWVLNGGGKHGTPVLVDADNFVTASRKSSK